MRNLAKFVSAIFVLSWIATSALAQGSYKVDSVPAPVATEVPKPLLDTLEPQGARVSGDQGTICEVWLRKALTLGPPTGGLGDILYGQLGAGNLIGVLHFPAQGADFRGQPFKPGYYAMRYAQIPTDGAHMGVFATRDAVLLTPVAADTALDQALSFADMVKLSKLVSGSPHPAFLVMASAEGATTFPAVGKDDHGNTALRLKVQGKNGELAIGITVVGQWVSE
jgi:hypothetical protein